MVDDSREEHRMLILGNDSDHVQEHLIRNETSRNSVSKDGILERKIHAESYTVTLYALLKDYGLTPVIRIKPRIRFHRSNYDNLSSSAPLRYYLDDPVHFAELKRGVDLTEKADNMEPERVFGDAPTVENLSEDAALQLVAQRDLFLRQPPFKTKTKVFGQGSDIRGIPIGRFLDALNHPQKAEEIFKPFPQGVEFARTLREELAPYENLEFRFGLYSRYERRDCVLAGTDSRSVEGYRTTFDPWTVLGYIRSDGDTQQLQVLGHERGTRWEHKIMVEEMEPEMVERLSLKIRELRRQYLIGRVLSKSQTALTLLAHSRESGLNLVKDSFIGYEFKAEIPIPVDRFAEIESRRRLRRAFSAKGQYRLHPFNDDMVETHLNQAKGLRNGVVYTLDNVYLKQGLPPTQKTDDDGLTLIKAAIHDRVVMRSAQDLRNRLPANGFEKCWNETTDEGGYTTINTTTGRCYTVKYGKRRNGNVLDGKVSVESPQFYLSITYLGITPERYDASAHKISKSENQVIREIKDFILYLKKEGLV
jgi:hypothetical protein